MRENEECLVFDVRDSRQRVKRKLRRRLDADDYDISMTRHGKIRVRHGRQLTPWKMDKKLKSENMQKEQFSMFVLFIF